ncbi:MAG: head-tail connector protein [Alphaproteobacteria bacterium]|nr:head-tail connector protein [Alphaproteobacteria bacterium]
MPSFKLVTPPAVEPVELIAARVHGRIDTDADDALISLLIIAARQWVEAYTGRALITQTWQLWLDNWPSSGEGVTLPRPPLASVSNITFYDESDAGTVWAAANYFVDTIREPGRVVLRSSAAYPTPSRAANGMKIEYVAGYGASGSAVPEQIKTAIRQLVAHWYEHRGEASMATPSRSASVLPVPMVIQALLEPYRIRSMGI